VIVHAASDDGDDASGDIWEFALWSAAAAAPLALEGVGEHVRV
jgi:hypothetical protein